MTDFDPTDLESIVEAIRMSLDERTHQFPDPRSFTLGKLQKDAHGTLPRAEWVELGGELSEDAAQVRTGGPNADIAVDEKSFELSIWGKDTRHCLALLYELSRVLRTLFDTHGYSLESYSWVDEGINDRGRKLVASPVILRTQVPAEIPDFDWSLVPIEHFDTTVTSAGTTVEIEQHATP